MNNETYEEFVEKFKPKKTTDDCYTPPEVYEVIKDWVCRTYNVDEAKIMRPFKPGGELSGRNIPGRLCSAGQPAVLDLHADLRMVHRK